MTSAYREQRRRKLLREDARSGGETVASSARSQPSAARRSYANAALRQNQPRITDLIPHRNYQLCLVWLLLLAPSAALMGAYFALLRWPWLFRGTSDAATLELLSAGSLAGWWNSMAMFLAAVLGMLVFHLRRHKLDDYRGRYRVWLIVSAGFLLASAAWASSWHETAAGMAMSIADRWHAADAVQRWGPWGLACLAGLVWLRLGIELWASRGASLAWFLAGVSFVTVACIAHGVWQPPGAQWSCVAQFAAWQVGIHEILFSLMLYLRFVYQSAQPQAGGAAPKTRKTRAAGEITATAKRAANPSAADDTSAPDADATASETESAPSKSERRRERKEMRRQQRAA